MPNDQSSREASCNEKENTNSEIINQVAGGQHLPPTPRVPLSPIGNHLSPPLSPKEKQGRTELQCRSPGAMRYQKFRDQYSSMPNVDYGRELAAQLGKVNPDISHLFEQNAAAQEQARRFMSCLFNQENAQEICSAVFNDKLAALKSASPDFKEKDMKSRCVGFAVFEQKRGDETYTFCVVSLSGALPDEGSELALSNLMSAVIAELNQKSEETGVTFIYKKNPSQRFRQLLSDSRTAEELQQIDWERPCAELSIIKIIMEIIANPQYSGNITINGGMFLFLAKPDEFGHEFVDIKRRDEEKKGYFLIESPETNMQFKGRPIKCCSVCQARMPWFNKLLATAVEIGKNGQNTEASDVNPLQTPISKNSELSAFSLFTNRFSLTEQRQARNDLSSCGSATVRRCLDFKAAVGEEKRREGLRA